MIPLDVVQDCILLIYSWFLLRSVQAQERGKMPTAAVNEMPLPVHGATQ